MSMAVRLAIRQNVVLVCLGRLVEVQISESGLMIEQLALNDHLIRSGGGEELMRQLRLVRGVNDLWIVSDYGEKHHKREA